MRRKMTTSLAHLLQLGSAATLCFTALPALAQDTLPNLEPRFLLAQTDGRARPGRERSDHDVRPDVVPPGVPPEEAPVTTTPTPLASLPEPEFTPPVDPGLRARPGTEGGPVRYPTTPGVDKDFQIGELLRPGPQDPDYIEPQPLPDPNRATGLGRTPKFYDPLAPEEFSPPVPDRWRLTTGLGLIQERWYDPYNFNVLKADRPVFDDWFVSVGLISDTVIEPRRVPTPVSPQVSRNPGDLSIFGGDDQFLFNQNLILALVAYKGNTVFRPPDYEFRITPVFNYNYTRVEENRVLNVNPLEGKTREDEFIGMQELFIDKHLRNVSDRYDFDSIRVGIQPFSTDFRGFLFQDNQLGIRLFGNRDNNLWQYNLAWFRRVEKDTNSGLNDIWEQDIRDDDIFLVNLYRQDWPVLGFVSQATVVHNRNREADDGLFFDNNGFLVRPASLGQERFRDYDVTYFGLNGDGHFGRLNLTGSLYYAYGDQTAGVFTGKPSDIRAFFAAAEASVDYDWVRLRASGLYATGDDDPYDDRSEGFDAIFENPIFAGADTSFWIRQSVPNIGGGGVTLSSRNGVLNSLRSSKDQGQSNFDNPGTILLGVGADLDLTPELRLSGNLNHLWFENTAVVEAARNQPIDRDIGWDVSLALIYRPFFSQNIIFRLSGAALIPGDGYEQLFGDGTAYSILGNIVLAY